jgi:hypothetical protein
MNIFWEFILPVFVILLVCYYMIPTFHHGVNVHLMKTTRLANTSIGSNNYNTNDTQHIEKQRTDKCSASKNELCAVGTYTQCTNNIINHRKCDCKDQRSYELCTNNTVDQLLSDDEVLKTPDKDYGKYATRVNQWTVDNTYYNEPTNLHIKRTNPYVEELK